MVRDRRFTEATVLNTLRIVQEAWQRTYAVDGIRNPDKTEKSTSDLPSPTDTVAALRTHADRQAAWCRWHAAVTEPIDISETERIWYNLFEQARVEELASRELRGMAKNLAESHAISTDSTLQARAYRLARQCFDELREQRTKRTTPEFGSPAPVSERVGTQTTEKAAAAAAFMAQNQRHPEIQANSPHQPMNWIRRWLHRSNHSEIIIIPSDGEISAALDQACLHLQDGTRFATMLWPLIQRLAAAPIPKQKPEPSDQLGCATETEVSDDAVPPVVSEPQTESAPKFGNEVDSGALAPFPTEEDADSSDLGKLSDPALETPYRAYRTQWDEEHPARHFCTPEDLTALQGLDSIDPARMRQLALRLQRRLLSARQRHWRFDQDSGRLDSRRLARLLVPGASARVFCEEQASPVPEAFVTLLVDQSGSMRGRPQQIAVQAIDLAVQTLEACRITCEVLGYTTVDGEDNPVARSWRAQGQPQSPGRLNARRHLIYKSALDPWRRVRPSLGLMLRADFGRENLDGEALDWAARRIVARPEPRKILLVLSDASPFDAATVAVHRRGYLEAHLRQVITGIEASAIHLVAIGTSHRVGYYYRNAVVINRNESVADMLFAKLGQLLSPPEPSRRSCPP